MTTRRLLGALVAMAFVFAACGGGDDKPTDDAGAEAGAPDPTDNTLPNNDGDVPDLPDGLDLPGTGFDSANCVELSDAFSENPLGDSLSSGEDPTEQFRRTAAYFESIAGDVPAEISGDIQALADAYGQLADASAAVDWAAIGAGDPSAIASVGGLAAAFAAPEILEATTNLTTYIAQNCVGVPG